MDGVLTMLGRWTLPWAAAKYHLSESLRSGEEGEPVVIYLQRQARESASTAADPDTCRPLPAALRGRIHLRPGWDDAIEVDHFLSGERRWRGFSKSLAANRTTRRWRGFMILTNQSRRRDTSHDIPPHCSRNR